MIWSYGQNDPADNDPMKLVKHVKRGTKTIVMRGQGEQHPLPPSAKSFNISNDVTVPSDGRSWGSQFDERTSYFCRGFKLDASLIGQKRHIVRVNIIDNAPSQKLHHVLLYHCPGTLTDAEINYRGPCHSTNMPDALQNCNGANPVVAWAIGGEPFSFPPEAGYPFGNNNGGFIYGLMETHYDNYDQVSWHDTSGVRIWYLEGADLRQHDAGIATFGAGGGFSVPALNPSYTHR